MLDLLPHNATPQERALEGSCARVGDVPVTVREMWNPDSCPVSLLPWLAWALSVDLWDPAWTEGQKRAAIRRAISVQQRKGTIGAVREALGGADLAVRVLEWHRQQTPGDPYTYRLLIEALPNAPVRSLAQIEAAIAAVDRTKSLRSHLDRVEITAASKAGPFVAAVSSIGSQVVTGPAVVPAEPVAFSAGFSFGFA